MLRNILAFLLGFLIPIDILGDVPPWILDGARYSSALILILLTRNVGPSGSSIAKVVVALLILISGVGLVRETLESAVNIESAALIGIVSIVVAYLVTRDSGANRTLMVGFLSGTCLSALDIVLQLLGLPFLGTPTEWGVRYPGLSFSSTHTAPFLALGVVMLLSRFLWRPIASHLIVRCALVILLTIGLVASGGRGGLAGLLLVLLVWVFVLLRSRPFTGVLAATVAAVVTLVSWEGFWSFIGRGQAPAEVSSGRFDLNAAAWGAFVEGGIFGVDVSVGRLHRPHTPILTFALDAGAVGLVSALLLVSIVAWRVFRPGAGGYAGEVLSMMAAVLFVTSLLEPNGFFVGLNRTIILMIVVSGTGLYDMNSRTQSGAKKSLMSNG